MQRGVGAYWVWLTASYDMHLFRVATELPLCYKWVSQLGPLDLVTWYAEGR